MGVLLYKIITGSVSTSLVPSVIHSVSWCDFSLPFSFLAVSFLSSLFPLLLSFIFVPILSFFYLSFFLSHLPLLWCYDIYFFSPVWHIFKIHLFLSRSLFLLSPSILSASVSICSRFSCSVSFYGQDEPRGVCGRHTWQCLLRQLAPLGPGALPERSE